MDTSAKIRRASSVIAFIGVGVSYGTQVKLLLHHGDDIPSALAIPLTVDVLGVICFFAVHSNEVRKAGRVLAGIVLPIVCGVSIAWNATGSQDGVARASHVWPVVAYLLGELIAIFCQKNPVLVVQEQEAQQQFEEQLVMDERKAMYIDRGRRAAETRKKNKELAQREKARQEREERRRQRELRGVRPQSDVELVTVS